ncbi:cytochrome c biogenesis protein CcsA, partial [Escherichia coli]|uniref:cytochrome c biogenesis protein CcsA n=1 Tax=Escherichia coli TaxID=562 RepID=UPI002573D5EB
VLLTLTLCTGLFYMHNLFSMENIDKAVLSIVAWFVYIVLLWGGTAACPPYHIAFVIGGTSAETNLKTVKLASAHYYDELPTEGN